MTDRPDLPQLSRARPTIDSATTRYLRGQIDRQEYERQVEQERRRDRQPPAEQTTNAG